MTVPRLGWERVAGGRGGPRAPAVIRPGSAGGLDLGEDEVVVRPGEDRGRHLAGVVAVVGEVLVDRDVPGVLGDGPVEVGQRLLLGVTLGTERRTERGVDG